jgi:hypothetical protein
MILTHIADELYKLEYLIRKEEAKLDEIITRRHEIEQKEGRIRTELNRLLIQKQRLLTTQNV